MWEVAVVLASGFWRWATRASGREPYRRLWSGVAGWILADQSVASAEARPTRWVVPRDEPVTWSLPDDSTGLRLVVQSGEGTVTDTTLAPGGVRASGTLPPGTYTYTVEGAAGDTVGSGRFDVAEATEEMLPLAERPSAPRTTGAGAGFERDVGLPLRTMPWPYLLVISLLCLEWVGRRRAGLR